MYANVMSAVQLGRDRHTGAGEGSCEGRKERWRTEGPLLLCAG